MASFVSLFEFQGVLSLVTCCSQGISSSGNRPGVGRALVEQVHFNPKTIANTGFLGLCL